MKPTQLLLKLLLAISLLPLSASALIMRENGPEPIIVQIKESLRQSDDLDNRLNELASRRQQHGVQVVKWWAGSKLLVMLSFPANFTEPQAMNVVRRLEELSAVERVVALSAYNLHFRTADFAREFTAGQQIPEPAKRGFDRERVGKQPYRPPEGVDLQRMAHVPNRLIVRWKEEHAWKADESGFREKMTKFHRQVGCRVVAESRPEPLQITQLLEFSDATTEQLAQRLKDYMATGWVVYAQPDFLYDGLAVPNDPWYSSWPGPQWGLDQIKAPWAWDITSGDPQWPVTLAVADTGANINHVEFSSNLWAGQHRNFIYGGTNVTDDNAANGIFHGSNVASIIGAQGDNGQYMSGVVWDTALMILKVLNSAGATSTSYYTAQAIDYAWQNGATAINLSLGARGTYTYCEPWYNPETGQTEGINCSDPEPYDRELIRSIRNARANNMLVVSAAGNGHIEYRNGQPVRIGDNADVDANITNPASIPTDNNIAVMATDLNETRPEYSDYGAARVDLGAPGGSAQNPIVGLTQHDNGSYSHVWGTSQAAPHVTGAIGLVKSHFRWENYLGLRDRILMAVDRTGALDGLCRTNGRLNVHKALQSRSMLLNLSSRARVEDGDKVMILGFTISGNPNDSADPSLEVAIRGLGPSLTQITTVSRLDNPAIELHGPDGVQANNNWYEDWNAQRAIDTGMVPPDGAEATMLRALRPGHYTVILRSEGNFGVGLAEIYALNANERSRLVNVSTRCLVGDGEEVVNAGIIIRADADYDSYWPSRRVLVLGKGPSIPVGGTLSDPFLQMYTTGDSNNNWPDLNPVKDELQEAGFVTSAHPGESAVWPTLRPGVHTMVLSSANSATGIGSIELYEY